MTEQAHGWPTEVAAASAGVLLSAALLAMTVSLSISLGLATSPVRSSGASLVTIEPGSAPEAGGSLAPARPGALTIADVDTIARAIPGVSITSRVVSGASPTVVVDRDPLALVQGVDPAYAQLWSGSVARGDFFSAQDASAANRVAVLGQTVATTLFPNGQSPIGQTIRVRNLPFTVVGVLANHTPLGPQTPDDTVLVPFQTAQVRLFGTGSMYELVLQVPDASHADIVTAQVQQLLRQRHRVGPGQTDDFTVRTGSISSAAQPSDVGAQTLRRTIGEVQHYGCVAKGICQP